MKMQKKQESTSNSANRQLTFIIPILILLTVISFISAIEQVNNNNILEKSDPLCESQEICNEKHKKKQLTTKTEFVGQNSTTFTNYPLPPPHERAFFRAAVYEHDRIDLVSPSASVRANLDAYDKVAKLASENHADIIVFPEDGLSDGPVAWLESVLEEIPDPEELKPGLNIPCLEPQKYRNSPILIRFSCMALSNKLHIVGNYGTKQKCTPKSMVGRKECPEKGEFAFNTNILIGPDGGFLRRYHKWNLFIEAFDRATDIETVFIDTPLGKFGIFTCFDIVFKKPAIDLIEKHKVDTILFPTWWFDELPLLTALSAQDGWSWANKVNLLASNIHKPEMGSAGSGIYSMNGNFINTGAHDTGPILLIANLPKRKNPIPPGSAAEVPFEPKIFHLQPNMPVQKYNSTDLKISPIDATIQLSSISGSKELCNNEICCNVTYEISSDTYDPKRITRLQLIARDGLRIGTFKWYEQSCFLAEVDSGELILNNPKANHFSRKASFKFHRLEISGHFNTRHVFPVGLSSVDELISRDNRQFTCQKHLPEYEENPMFACKHRYESTGTGPKSIVSFGLYARVYERDQIDTSHIIVKRWPEDDKK